LLPLVVKYEVQRQLKLMKISEELRAREVKEENIKEEFINVTTVFKQTKCKVLRKAIDKKQQILAVKLPKFKGFLKQELIPSFRLGTEMSDRARFWGRVGGIFHTDELPAYGITKKEVEKLREVLEVEDQDAVVLVADNPENAKDALKAVVERAREAIKGVPPETRAPNPDGTTRYMRPRPGAARMYPETDIPPIQITEDYIRETSSQLPELPKQKLERLMKEYRLNQKLARQVLDSEYSRLFESIAEQGKVSPTTVAAFLTETLKALKRDGVQVDKVSESQIREIFNKISAGELTKEAIPDVTVWLSSHENKSVQDAIKSLSLKTISENELKTFVEKVIEDNRSLIQERGENNFRVFMGIIMKELRGKVDAASVDRVLREKLKEFVRV